jgi:hypothetical protein
LPPSPPKIGKPQPSKTKVDRPVKSSARRKSKEDSDDGIDEIPAAAQEVKANKNGKKQQKSKRVKKAGNRKATNDFDDDEVEPGVDNDNEAPTQVAVSTKKRKASQPDPIEDAEGGFRARVPGKVTIADVHADDEDEPQSPKKKGKKSNQVG